MSDLTLGDVLDRVIADGIDAARRDYSEGQKLDGSVAGFEACQGRTPAQLAVLLDEARAERHAAAQAGAPDYWFWACRCAEVEWVCNVVSAVLMNEGLPTIVPPTARGVLKAADVVGVSA